MMIHSIKIEDRTIKMIIDCVHPAVQNNNCPIKYGNCGECKWCKATMSGEEALFLLDIATKDK